MPGLRAALSPALPLLPSVMPKSQVATGGYTGFYVKTPQSGGWLRGEMAHKLKALVALLEDQSSVSGTHTGWLTTTYNSST